MSAPKQYRHQEAFCLMWYACESCGARVRIWNSRDGVTPFAMPCASCGADGLRGGMRHVDWHLDEQAPDHQPAIGQLVWEAMSIETARTIAERRVLLAAEAGRVIDGADLERLVESFYRGGEAPALAIHGYTRSGA